MTLPTPYYHDEAAGITIFCGDAGLILPALQPASVDLVLTDPPYGIDKAHWDAEFPTWWFDDAARIAPALGIMPGVWNLTGLPQKVGRLRYKWTLSAHLSNGMTRGAIGFANWIPCVVYGTDMEAEWCARFADWCDANGITRRDLDAAAGTSDMGDWWLSRLPHRSQIPTPQQWVLIRGRIDPPLSFDSLVYGTSTQQQGDCRSFTVGREAKQDHPSPKPLNVTTWFVSRLPGRSVLDPFMGSGTTLRAAKDLGRKAIGIELEERYCEIAVRRLQQSVLPLGEGA